MFSNGVDPLVRTLYRAFQCAQFRFLKLVLQNHEKCKLTLTTFVNSLHTEKPRCTTDEKDFQKGIPEKSKTGMSSENAGRKQISAEEHVLTTYGESFLDPARSSKA